MKIKVERDVRDRNTKKLIKAGTVIEADEKRLSLLNEFGIKYEVVEEPSLLNGNVEQVKKALNGLDQKTLAELLEEEKKDKKRKSVIEHINALMTEGD